MSPARRLPHGGAVFGQEKTPLASLAGKDSKPQYAMRNFREDAGAG